MRHQSDSENSDISDISFEIQNDEFNMLYTKQLEKRNANIRPVKDQQSPRDRQRPRSRSREKERRQTWLIQSIDLSQDRITHPQIKSLPIFKKKQEILHRIIKNQITIVTGQTGCGKSTQVPRLIYQYLLKEGKIICVQPRRLAVKNLFRILSSQIKEKNAVGYQIAMQTFIKEQTKIVFVTNGIFLQRLIHGTSIFQEYPFIILDEVHERDIDTDFILLAMKRLVRKFPKLRLILMSATIDNKLFQYYFAQDEVDSFMTRQNFYKKYIRLTEQKEKVKKHISQNRDDFQFQFERPDEEDRIYKELQMQFMKAKYPCPAINITQPGKYRKDYFYLDTMNQFIGHETNMKWGTVCFSHKYPCAHRELNQMVNVLLNKILFISDKDRKQSGVLIFMPGLAEIQNLASDISGFFGKRTSQFEIILCHSSILNDQITRKLHTQYRDKIKVIIATNIAESSITVMGIKYIIDYCLSKQINFDQKSRMENLELVWASKASCKQRAGRTGRVCDGIIFRLVEKKFYAELPQYSTPQIQRSSLDKSILRIKLIHENQPENQKLFEDPGDVLGTAIQPPNLKNIDQAIKSLIFCGGLRLQNSELILTSLGRIYVDIPLDIIYSKMLLFSLTMGTYNDILILVCLLSQNKNAFKKITVERNFLQFFQMMSNQQRCDFISLIKSYKNKEQRKQYLKIELDIYHETRQLVQDVNRRLTKKNLVVQNSLRFSEDDYWERFKVTIMFGFLSNLIKISPMLYDDKQQKRATLMKKLRIPIHNTIILLNSDIIRRSHENSQQADNKLKKNWLQHISRTFRIEQRYLDMTLGYGISYLHFQRQQDLNKFLFVKNMEKNKKIPYEAVKTHHLTLNQVLPHLGDIDYMEEGNIGEFYKDQKINIDNFSMNRIVGVAPEPSKSFPSYRYLITNTIIQQSTRLNCRYTSLLPDIPHIQVILHLLFYPFVVLLPDKKLTRYDGINLKKKSKVKINYELTDQEIIEANLIRSVIKELFELKLIVPEAMLPDNDISDPVENEDRYIPKDPRVRKKTLEERQKQQEMMNALEQMKKLQTFWGMVKAFIVRERKQIIGEDIWQDIYFQEKKIKRTFVVEKFIKQEEKQYMNPIKTLKLNFSYFSDRYPSQLSREERYNDYIRWKVNKLKNVRAIESRANNHDAYLICGVDDCKLKVAKMSKIGCINDQYYRELIEYEKNNIVQLQMDDLNGDPFFNTVMGMYIEKQYDFYGCTNRHTLAIKFRGQKNLKITSFSEISILYTDESIEEYPEFEKLQYRDWKRKNDKAIEKKLSTKEQNYCFMCNQTMKNVRDLATHVKTPLHLSNVVGFVETIPKAQKMEDENDYPY